MVWRNVFRGRREKEGGRRAVVRHGLLIAFILRKL